jgi:murein DD-endopeptidase / murein LD-carboxypeptidase
MMETPKSIRVFALSLTVMLFSYCSGNKHATAGADAQLKKKYAGMLGVPENEITNLALYRFIDDWYGTPYKYGGKSKAGIDCSGFVSALYSQVYKKMVAGSAKGIYENSEHISENKLKEGDFVFFKINSKNVSHVGVYLRNRHFVHASSHKGVVISTLDESYYKKYFFKGGRMKGQ